MTSSIRPEYATWSGAVPKSPGHAGPVGLLGWHSAEKDAGGRSWRRLAAGRASALIAASD